MTIHKKFNYSHTHDSNFTTSSTRNVDEVTDITWEAIDRGRKLLFNNNLPWGPTSYTSEEITMHIKKIYDVKINPYAVEKLLYIARTTYKEKETQAIYFDTVFEICGFTDKIMINDGNNEFISTYRKDPNGLYDGWFIHNKKRNNLVMWNTNRLNNILGFNLYPKLVKLFKDDLIEFKRRDYILCFDSHIDADNVIDKIESLLLVNKLKDNKNK
ncbi:MAG: hypothetical protein ACOCP8_01975 [archaeon]